MNEIRESIELIMIFTWNLHRLRLPNEFLYPFDSSYVLFQWYRSSLVIRAGRITSKSLKLRLVGPSGDAWSLKSILHAGYLRLSPFIGDYLSGFRKEDRHNALDRIEITSRSRRQKSALSSLILFFCNVHLIEKRE